MQVQYKSSYPAMVNGQWRSPQCTEEGVLKVAVEGGGGGGTVDQGEPGELAWPVSVSNTPNTPVIGAGIRGAKRYFEVPPEGIDCLAQIPTYGYPACGFFIVAGTTINITQPLGTTVSFDVSAGYYWPDCEITSVNATSDLQDFYLLWK
ncbi:hypothetical protein [Polyangium spumosum]|uniref:Uncharacterized protein n=1 Tax=Polyangium spumosum TaxID=889282 RepID=A0A6N7Q7F4_9BACT|nr:hypothetical protein [Polyangium spumosum]MRG98224.1 hypothetical protein [Polyangium spumosum]